MDRLGSAFNWLYQFLSQSWVTASLMIAAIVFMGYLYPLFDAELGLPRLEATQEAPAVAADKAASQPVLQDNQPATRLSGIKTICSDGCFCPVEGNDPPDGVYDVFARATLWELEVARTPTCFCQIVRTWERAIESTQGSAGVMGTDSATKDDVALLHIVNWLKRMHLSFDLVFPIIYGLGLASLIAWIARRHPLGKGDSVFLKTLFALPLLAWLLDWVENGFLLLTIRGISEQSDLGALSALFIRLMTIAAWVKWWLVVFVILMAMLLWIWSGWRTCRYWRATVLLDR